MINHARKRQRDLFATLIDLRNAFREVHHSVLNKVLEYHHVLNEVKSLIQNMYKDFNISIGTKCFITDQIKVERGLLQGRLPLTTIVQYVFQHTHINDKAKEN